MTATEERKKALAMAGPVWQMSDCVIGAKGKEPPQKWSEYNKPDVTFAMVTGAAQTNFIKDDMPEAKIMSLKEMSEAIMAVQSGRAGYMLQELPICIKTFESARGFSRAILSRNLFTASLFQPLHGKTRMVAFNSFSKNGPTKTVRTKPSPRSCLKASRMQVWI